MTTMCLRMGNQVAQSKWRQSKLSQENTLFQVDNPLHGGPEACDPCRHYWLTIVKMTKDVFKDCKWLEEETAEQ